ncbi:tyrosine-protein kinase HTK16-like isoform X1 [Lineus longissimus]|uniref:tyrosine-protein kinase HTK16-like isoform X1 n=1 Tax=Lineus longissimus TaxID=88925 RepID=UPI002B4DD6E7
MENQVQPGGDGTPSNNAYTNHLISADGKNKITHLLEVYGGTKEALEALLKEDADNAEKELSSMYWYHGSISREEAEIALGKGGCSDGLYLVRASQSTPGNFAISLAAKGKLHHFQITECGEVYFNIDKGTIFQGLENLINAHKELSHGLPSKLRKFIRKGPPPPSACRYGWTNFLHKAVIEGNAAIVRKILESTLCPDINAKSSAAYHGSAALHDAAYLGHDAIILQLLAKGADVRLRDSNSMTPLHKAAEGNQPNSIKILIEKGKADPHERSLVTGSVPMHIAAKYGHTECLKALLSFGAPCWPRDEDDSTPYQLAERLHHKDAAKLLNEYRSPRPNVHMSDWYHRNLKREAAAELFHNVEAKDGTFLVRDSSKHPHWHVLAVICQGTVFNFEIKNYENHVFSYIDDGPYLESIEHVIEHYSQRADGLPCKLEMAITPAGKLLDIKLLRPKRGGGIKEAKKKKGKIPPPLVLTEFKSSSHIPPPTPDVPISPSDRRPSLPVPTTHTLEKKISNEKRPSLPNNRLLPSPSPSPKTVDNFLYPHHMIDRPPQPLPPGIGSPDHTTPTSPGGDRPPPNTDGVVNLLEKGLRNLPTRDVFPQKPSGQYSPLSSPKKSHSPLSNSPRSCSPMSNSPKFCSPSNSPLSGSPIARSRGRSNPADRPQMPLPSPPQFQTNPLQTLTTSYTPPPYKTQQSHPAAAQMQVAVRSPPGYHSQLSAPLPVLWHPQNLPTQQSCPRPVPKVPPKYQPGPTHQLPLPSCTDLPAPPSLQPPVLPAAVDDRPPPPPQKPPHISAKPPSQEPDYPPPPPPPSVTDLSNVPSPSSPSKGKHLKAFFKKSKKVKEKSPIANPTSEYAEPTSPGEFLLIPYPSMELEREIGQGEFGSVYRGTWKKPNGKKQSVAVKTLHPEIMHTASSKEQFLVEAKVMAKLDHPCIVKLIGVSEGKLLLMVQELVAMGSLLNYLIEYPERIEKSELYLWAAQIACGMMYLETKKFVHRDLAARNILLASVKQIKISDFGLSRAVGVGSDYYQASKGGRWPVKWYAPECVYYGTFSNASDVWSFGVTLWEMFSYGAQPYEEVAAKEVIAQIDAGERLPQPEKCPDKDYETMNKCWQYNAADRPTFDELNARFADDPDYASINDLVIGRKWRES